MNIYYFRLAFIMLLTLSFLVSDAYLYGHKGERDRKYSYKWDKRAKQETSIEGKIKKQADFGPAHSILLETTKGDIYVNLGSTRRIKSKGLKLFIGDKIKLKGYYIAKSRYKILIPLELTKGSKTYKLMSKKRFWKGFRKRKRWDDSYDDDRYEHREYRDDDRYEYREYDDDDRYEYREYDDDDRS